MLVAFELSGEHPELPRAEVVAALNAMGLAHGEVAHSDGQLLVSVECQEQLLHKLASRLSLSRYVLCVLAVAPSVAALSRMAQSVESADIGESFCVRARGVGGIRINSEHVEKKVGALVHTLTGKRVSFSSPESVLRVLVGKERCVLGRVVSATSRRALQRERPHERAFFHPGVMLSVLARAVVNLTETKERGRLLDPFCGTGGLLIEAARTECIPVGGDAQSQMLRGASANLAQLGLYSELACLDATSLPFSDGSMDGAACDPPYGRSARRMAESDEVLYTRSLFELERVLRKGANAVMVYAHNLYKGEPIADVAKRAGFELEGCFTLRVHKSLTRCILVLHKG
ncbi:MAG: methyltransferase domain-containing protein [Methermicoccaceae archaeon]